MNTTVRVYDSADKADEAAALLREEGLPKDLIVILKPSEDEIAQTQVASAVAAELMPARFKTVAADNLAKGRTVVVVQPPFGKETAVVHHLDSKGPIEVELPEYLPSSPAPLSEILGMPVLTKRGWRLFGSTVEVTDFSFSDLFRLPVLSRRKHFLGLGKMLATPKYPANRKFMTGTISEKIGLKPVISRKGGKRSTFGIPLLTKGGKPTTSVIPLLTDESRDED